MKTTIRALTVTIAIGGASIAAEAGPIGVLYLTTYNEIGAVQGDNVIYQQTQQVPFEWAIAVGDTVRTASYWASLNGDGTEYALGLSDPIGTTSTPNVNFLADGATDGQYNYGAAYNTVYRFGTDWSGGEELFTIEGPDNPGIWIGITYDPFTNSLWVMEWQDQTGKGTTVAQFSMAGVLLSSFSTGMGLSGNTAGLAMDYADGTLWLSDENMWFQFGTDGTLLGSQAYAGGARGGAPLRWRCPRRRVCVHAAADGRT